MNVIEISRIKQSVYPNDPFLFVSDTGELPLVQVVLQILNRRFRNTHNHHLWPAPNACTKIFFQSQLLFCAWFWVGLLSLWKWQILV